jgi:hypothetical protein
VRRGDHDKAEEYAHELAARRGNPSAWKGILREAGGDLDVHDEAPKSVTRRRSSTGGLAGFYDRNPKVCLTATVAVSTVAGVRLNQRVGQPVPIIGPISAWPSSIGGVAALLAALGFHAAGMKRSTKLLLAGAVGQGLATGVAHMPEGALMGPRPTGPKA